ncbi:PP2C family protein-serine/threonine phosphatase [Nocardioides nitrophenolicus]|uniref:PP2C family protein-serine/threonine phosphatase n=1 Tax=Nocardioides nitrophenolicus TaxID=60489 RepID=UPI00195DE2AD|nr:protein phosphatase 2C domain-containing protein [Nocardioides nitrophenolicus]MBM7515559.1 protein phosphatase [Nocardioides nitrophenolicus]
MAVVRVDATGAHSWSSPGRATRLVHAAATHPGRVRSVNEDSSLVAPPVFLIADGMGGYARGDVASRLVVESFESLASLHEVLPADVEAAIATAQTRVAALAAEFSSAPGSTLVTAAYVLEDGHGYWLLANIGDSRAYTYAGGVLEQISKDHSVVQELIDAGRLTRDQALGHPERHVVTRAIGALTRSEADFALIPAEPGSRLLLCSDGLTSELSDTAILHILSEGADPGRTSLTLVDAAVAAGGHDNVTVVVVDVEGVGASAPSAERTAPGPPEGRGR